MTVYVTTTKGSSFGLIVQVYATFEKAVKEADARAQAEADRYGDAKIQKFSDIAGGTHRVRVYDDFSAEVRRYEVIE